MNDERDLIVSKNLKEKLNNWIEKSAELKLNIFLTAGEVRSKAKKPLFSSGDSKPYWYSYTHHNIIGKSVEIIFGMELGGMLSSENVLFTREGFYYFRKETEYVLDKKGNKNPVKHYIPELIPYYLVSGASKVEAAKKFFGGASEKKSEVNIGGEYKIELKKEIADFFIEIIDVVKSSLENYSLDLSTSKEKMITGISLSVTSANEFEEFIMLHEDKIAKIDVKHLHSFVKLSSFLSTKENSIKSQSNYLIEKTYEIGDLNDLQEKINNQISLYHSLYLLSINMVVALIEEKSIMFFKIYELFDRQGVFNSVWQKEISNILNEVNSNIKEVINKIDSLEFTLGAEIRSLENSLSDRILDMQKSTEESLGSIGARINYGSMVSTMDLLKK
jgi:hypothetical protein